MTVDHNLLPATIYKYRVYNDDEEMMGVGDELTLPDFESMSSTVAGAGIMGELDLPVLGMFKSMELEIPFTSLYSDFKSFAKVGHAANCTIRAATYNLGTEDSEPKAIGVRIAVRGICKKVTLGKVKAGEGTDTKTTIELTYIACYVDDQEVIVIDKLNDVYRVDGVDQLLNVSSLI